jgi:O-antigen ligase
MLGILITYGLMGWAVIGSLVNPYHGFLAYVALATIRPQGLWGWALPSGDRTSLICAGAMTVGWVIRLGGNWKFGRSIWGLISLVAFWGWSYVSGLAAQDQAAVQEFLDSTFKIVFPCLIGLAAIRTIRDIQLLALTMLVSQTIVSYYMNDYYFFARINVPLEGYANMGRAVFGASLVMCLTISMAYAMLARRLWWRVAAFICCGLIGHTVLLTYSRGALLGMIVTGVVLVYLIPKEKSTLLMLGVILALFAAATGQSVLERFETIFASKETRDASAQSRIDLWMGCLNLIARDPILGVGPNHFPMHAPRFGYEEWRDAHQLWLQTAAEIGIPGAFFLLVFYLAPMPALWKLTRRPDGRFDPELHRQFQIYASIALAAVCGFFVTSQFITIEMLETPYYFGVMALGVVKIADATPRPNPDLTDDEIWDDVDADHEELYAHLPD